MICCVLLFAYFAYFFDWQSKGHRFDSDILHVKIINYLALQKRPSYEGRFFYLLLQELRKDKDGLPVHFGLHVRGVILRKADATCPCSPFHH